MKATILVGDVLERLRELPGESVQCVVTSPPYWGLRDYGTALWEGGEAGCEHKNLHGVQGSTGQRAGRTFTGAQNYAKKACGKCGAVRIDAQLGLEKTPAKYIARMVEVFREVRRVLRKDGTLWLNMGDSYAGSPVGTFNGGGFTDTSGKNGTRDMSAVESSGQLDKLKGSGLKPKDLCGIPWMLAFALRADGWWLRQDIIWSKPNPMPESVTDRCTKAHEYVFLLSKSARYYWDQEAIAEDAAGGKMDVQAGWATGSDHSAVGWATEGRQGRAVSKSGNKGRELGPKGTEADSDENRSGRGALFGRGAGWRDDPELSPATRNKRSVWEITTQPFAEAHFATFPEKLVEPCILAGTSERGACPQCGAPWERVVERGELVTPADRKSSTMGQHYEQLRGADHFKPGSFYPRETTGWQPTCRCAGGDPCSLIPVPCIVLDPFCGSGTVGVVALRYRRDFVGIELNPEYAEMAQRRIGNEAPLLHSVETR